MLQELNAQNNFLILGCPKSGSTLLCHILNSHTQICCLKEPESYIFLLHKQCPSTKPLIGYKVLQLSSEITLCLDGKIKIIWSKRCPYDNIYSILKRLKPHQININSLWQNKLFEIYHYDTVLFVKNLMNTENFELAYATLIFKSYEFLLDFYKQKKYEIYEKKHEDLVFNTEKTLQEICEFLNVPFEADMLTFHQNSGENFNSFLDMYTPPPTQINILSHQNGGMFSDSQKRLINNILEI